MVTGFDILLSKGNKIILGFAAKKNEGKGGYHPFSPAGDAGTRDFFFAVSPGH